MSQGEEWDAEPIGEGDVGGAAPFLCLGTCEYVSHEGEKPISMVWRLRREMPGETFLAASVVAG